MNINFISNRFWNTKKRRFINFAKYFAISSVVVGVLALLISLAVLEGYDRTLRKNAIKFSSHLILQNFNHKNIKNYEEISERILNIRDDIKKLYPTIQSEALVRHKNNAEGIMIRGVNSEYIKDKVKPNIIVGKGYLDKKGDILIGKRLADKLNAKIGDKIQMFLIKSDDIEKLDYKVAKFIVAGIYESTMAQYDDVLVYIDFQEAQAINSININEITNFEIMLDDVTMAKSVGAELEQYLGYPFFAITVFDSHQYIFTWIEMQKQPIPIVLGIIMIIASFNIITTLLIMVLEKLPHIGVLRALGFTKNQIVRLFLMQGLNIAIKGVLIGGSIAFIFSYLQLKYHFIKLNGDIYFLDVLPIKIIPFHYILVISITLILSLLATIIPAIIASRINIIKALKFR